MQRETLGPEAFRLGEMFDLSMAMIVSIHLAMNFKCKDMSYSLFWHHQKTYTWSSSGGEGMKKLEFPLLGSLS